MGLSACDGPMETVEYMWVVHRDLQYQKLLQSPGINSLFFMIFKSFNYVQIKIWHGSWLTFLVIEWYKLKKGDGTLLVDNWLAIPTFAIYYKT